MFLAVMLAAFNGGTSAAVERQSSGPLSPPPARVAPGAKPGSLRIGPRALLRITVPDRPLLTNTYRVDLAGTVTLPELGQVSVNGLTLQEASNDLSGRLGDARGRPLRVRVEFDRSLQSVFVAGEVRSPGLITMNAPLSLMKALARAGSPTPAASDILVVIHANDVAKGPPSLAARETRTRIDIGDLQVGHDVMLSDGDTVYVPKAQRFYILGEIRRPGVYLIDPGMTVLQAIALAGGLTSRASDRDIKILRMGDGEALEIDTDLGTVIQPDDTIRVRPRRF